MFSALLSSITIPSLFTIKDEFELNTMDENDVETHEWEMCQRFFFLCHLGTFLDMSRLYSCDTFNNHTLLLRVVQDFKILNWDL